MVCIPEGLKIICCDNDYCDRPRKYRITPKVTVSLVSVVSVVCCSIYSLALDCLYKKNVFIIDMTCTDAIKLLKKLSLGSCNTIKNIYLTDMVLWQDYRNWISIAEDLVGILAQMKNMHETSVDMPHDLLPNHHRLSCKALFAQYCDRISVRASRDILY